MKTYNSNSSGVMDAGNHFKNLASRGNIFSVCSLLLISIMFSSCATLISGSKQKIAITGNIDVPVQILSDGRTYSDVTFPATVKIKRWKRPSKILAFAPDYNVEKQEFRKSFNWVTLPTIWTNFFFVDLISGAFLKSKVKTADFTFTPANSNVEVSKAYTDFGMEYFNNMLYDDALKYFQKAYSIDEANKKASDMAIEAFRLMREKQMENARR